MGVEELVYRQPSFSWMYSFATSEWGFWVGIFTTQSWPRPVTVPLDGFACYKCAAGR